MFFLAGTLGLYGIVLGFLGILLHLTSLRSFGVPYFSPIAPLTFKDLKDVLIRTPIWDKTSRPQTTDLIIRYVAKRTKTKSKSRETAFQVKSELILGEKGKGTTGMKSFMYIGLIIIILITSGCWDRTEINDLAFVMGTALDLTDDGDIRGSVQVAVPITGQGTPRGESAQGKFFVVSAVGKSSNEVILGLQRKLSRRLYYAHRSVVFIGEKLAKHGIKDILDFFSRDPHSRLRTYIMVVKGGEGREILEVRYPFEVVPTEAVKEMEILGSDLGVTLRDLFMAASSDGIHPVMGVIEPAVPSEGLDERKNIIFKLAGSALFKDFKLVGLLDEKETGGLLWMTNQDEEWQDNRDFA